MVFVQGVIFNVKLVIDLAEGEKRLGSRQIFQVGTQGRELNIVVKPNDFASLGSLDIFLGYIAGLVVEKPVGIAAPGYAAHIDPKYGLVSVKFAQLSGQRK